MKQELHEWLGWPGPVTHRQFLAWMAWFDMQWNKPNRSDHYLAKIAFEIRCGNVQRPRDVKFDDMILKFEEVTETAKDPEFVGEKFEKVAQDMAMATWMMHTGMIGTDNKEGG